MRRGGEDNIRLQLFCLAKLKIGEHFFNLIDVFPVYYVRENLNIVLQW